MPAPEASWVGGRRQPAPHVTRRHQRVCVRHIAVGARLLGPEHPDPVVGVDGAPVHHKMDVDARGNGVWRVPVEAAHQGDCVCGACVVPCVCCVLLIVCVVCVWSDWTVVGLIKQGHKALVYMH